MIVPVSIAENGSIYILEMRRRIMRELLTRNFPGGLLLRARRDGLDTVSGRLLDCEEDG